MLNSFAVTAVLTCPHCNQDFSADLWIIIDTLENPDLLLKAQDGTLHELPCPTCQVIITVDVPLLIFRPDRTPALLFSPVQQTSREENQAQAHNLIEQLLKSVGSAWNNEWSQDMILVPKDQLPAMLRTKRKDVTQQTAAQSDLETILQELNQPDRQVNILRRIQLCQQALALVSVEQNPPLWAELQDELGNSLIQNSQGNRVQNIERAIATYQKALTVRSKDTLPIEWATTMTNLAIAYNLRVQGKRAENLELAIVCYQQALQVFTQEAMCDEWATVMMNLATVYQKRIRGERAENLELSIAYYQQALTIRDKEVFPVDWARTVNNLAYTYGNRIRGERAENLELSIVYYQQALQVFMREEMPEEWATIILNLGITYQRRIRGERAENLELAIMYYQQALQVFAREEMPIEWTQATNNLASAYKNRIRGERAQNLELAIVHFQQVLHVRTREAMPIEWAGTMNNLGLVYANRIRGERAQNLELAIEYYRQALQVFTQESLPIDWAQTTNNFANAYSNRIRGERVQNLELAIEHYWQVLQVFTRDAMPVDWAGTVTNLASAYQARIRGERAQNLEKAIELYEQALQVRTQEAMPVEWAQTVVNLALSYVQRVQGERTENLELAITHYQKALVVYTQESIPTEWSQTMNNLAIAYYFRRRGERTENLEQAIARFQQALQVRTRDAMPTQWAETINNLAITYNSRILGEKAENLEKAIVYHQQALQIFTQEAFPVSHGQIQRNLGTTYSVMGRWMEAVDAFHGALAAGELLYMAAATPEARQIELSEIRAVPSQLAYIQMRHMNNDALNLAGTVMVLERNRARWLAESLALRSAKPAAVPSELWERFEATAAQIRQLQSEAQLPDDTPGKWAFLTLSALLTTARAELTKVIAEVRRYAPEFMPEPSFADIQRALATTDGAVAEVAVYLLTTSQGGLALLVYGHDIIPIWLDAFTDATSRTLLRGWFDAYNDFLREQTDSERTRWFEQVEGVTGQLWTLAMGPVAAALGDLDLPSHTREQPKVVTLIPLGLMALLPLHAAWTADHNTLTGRRYFLDDYAVRYAPSATALRHCRERVIDVNVEQLLALDEPKPIRGAGPLPNAAREVKAIASLFPAPTFLQHEQANREATLDALSATQVAHFSCHGTNNWQNPLDSGLLLANDELLTMRDFLELHLPGARLATLSACETGIVGTDLPDEVIMLPSALVQAGYAGVVASLWSVADVSTAMLMVRFYEYWREEELEPVHALRKAQRWVRDTTNQEKAQYFGQFVPGLGTRMAEGVAAEFFSAAMLAEEGLEARSFAHPFWWAAFYLTGV